MAVQFFWDAKKISLSKVSRFGFSFSLWRVYFYQKYNYALCNGGEFLNLLQQTLTCQEITFPLIPTMLVPFLRKKMVWKKRVRESISVSHALLY